MVIFSQNWILILIVKFSYTPRLYPWNTNLQVFCVFLHFLFSNCCMFRLLEPLHESDLYSGLEAPTDLQTLHTARTTWMVVSKFHFLSIGWERKGIEAWWSANNFSLISFTFLSWHIFILLQVLLVAFFWPRMPSQKKKRLKLVASGANLSLISLTGTSDFFDGHSTALKLRKKVTQACPTHSRSLNWCWTALPSHYFEIWLVERFTN